jgi:hypothetical protein
LFTNEIRVIPIRNKEKKKKIPALKDLMKEEEEK